ncbi:MAG: hypothetical protein KTR25_04470 [Myxococcales bacterium]|nr:hypothetical protein [Myxococcales bacterium]
MGIRGSKQLGFVLAGSLGLGFTFGTIGHAQEVLPWSTSIPAVCQEKAGEEPSLADGYQASGLGLDRLSRGDVEAAIVCLEFAYRLLPDSEVIARDLGVAYAQATKLEEAQAQLLIARELGDTNGDLELALVLGENLAFKAALTAALRAGGIEGRTIAASLGDGAALHALRHSLKTAGVDRPISRLLLAAEAARSGAVRAAAIMAKEAQEEAELLHDSLVLNAARTLRSRLDQVARLDVQARVNVVTEHIHNPLWLSEVPKGLHSGWASSVVGELNLTGHLGAVSWEAGLVADQRIFLINRDELAGVERLAILGYVAMIVPLSEDLRSAKLRVGLRAIEVRSDRFRKGLATAVEGGPTLTISVAPRWSTELGIYGIWSNLPESEIRNLARDRVGQRVRGALLYQGSLLTSEVELIAMNDDAAGQVFSASGVALSGWVHLEVSRWWQARAAASVLVRRWGPVGNEAVIGAVIQETDVRWTTNIGLSRKLNSVLAWTIDSFFVRNEASASSRYIAHDLRLGVEAKW